MAKLNLCLKLWKFESLEFGVAKAWMFGKLEVQQIRSLAVWLANWDELY